MGAAELVPFVAVAFVVALFGSAGAIWRAGRAAGRASAFAEMADELQRAAREGAPPSAAARMMREAAAQQLERDSTGAERR